MANGTYNVSYLGHRQDETGMRDMFEFEIVGPAGDAAGLRVDVSRSLQVHLGLTDVRSVARTAAQAVVHHLRGAVPGEYYSEDGSTIQMTIYWYPGRPGEPDMVESYRAFEVESG